MSNQDSIQQRIARALADDVPRIYVNGFITLRGNTELTLVYEFCKRPVGNIVMSYETAKSLYGFLGDALKEVESKLGAPILSLEELEDKMQDRIVHPPTGIVK